jgi:hypothetical protein
MDQGNLAGAPQMPDIIRPVRERVGAELPPEILQQLPLESPGARDGHGAPRLR